MLKKTHDKIPDTIVVGDTSAIISLSVGSVLLKCLSISRIVIPGKVHQELKEMSEYNDEDGVAAKETLNLIAQGKISVIEIRNKDNVKAIVSSNARIDNGEAEALVLAQENLIPIVITDDFRSLPYLKEISMGVEIHLSIYLLTRLVIENIISKEEAKASLNKIAGIRTWENAAIYRLAMKYIDEL